MSTTPVNIPMFDPTGQVRQIPMPSVKDALGAGGKLAIRMADPNGVERWVPHDMREQALAAGGKMLEDPSAHPQIGALANAAYNALAPFNLVTLPASGGKVPNILDQAQYEASAMIHHPLATTGAAVTAPFQSIASGSQQELEAAKKAASEKKYGAAAVRGLYSGIPIVGPQLGQMAEQSARGDISGAAGTGIGLGLQVGLASPELPGAVRSGAAGLINRVMRPAPPPTAAEAALPKTGAVRGAIRNYMGIGGRMVQRTATEAAAEHATATTKVAEANRIAATEHAADTAKVQALNDAASESVGRRAMLAQTVTENATDIGQQVKALNQQVRTVGSGMFENVARAVEGDSVPASNLAEAVRHAETNIIRGSTENIKQFRELVQKGEPQEVATSVGEATPGTPLYEVLVQSGAIDPAQPLGFRDLQGYYTELGQKMQGESVPGDVYRALKHVRESVGKEMQAMANAKGVGEQLTQARAYWRQYEQTFHDMRPVSQGGSPVARVLRAEDPGYVAAPLTGKASARAVTMLGQYSKEVAGKAGRLAADYQQMNSLPKKFTPKALPEAPTPKPMPEPMNFEQALREARQARIGGVARNLRSVSGWDIASVAGGGLQIARGQIPSAFAITVLRHGIGAWLDRPAVVRWLSAPTAEDFAAIRALPVDEQALVQKAMGKFYQNHPETPPNAAASGFMASAAPTVTLGPGAEGISGTTRSINISGQKVGHITYDISGDTATIHHFGGPERDYKALSNKLGRRGLQEVVQQLKQQHPEITHVQGIRVGGLRGDEGRSVRIEIPKEPSPAAQTPVRQENAFYTQARAELGASATPDQVLARVQQMKAQGVQMPMPPPSIVHRATTKAHPLTGAQRSAAIGAVMSQLKSGEISEQDADRQIQRINRGGGRKLVRMPEAP